MSLSTQDKKDIADAFKDALISVMSQKQETPSKKGNKEKKQEKNASPPHKKSEIPQLIQQMNQKENITLFGNILETDPYKLNITPFYNKYNIQLDPEKYERKTLTYEQKHSIIMLQLKGTSKKVFDAQKKRHLKFLREKLANPPETNIFGRTMSDKNLENWQNALTKEVQRWESEQYKE